jgi:retron-type reverse transcriptase
LPISLFNAVGKIIKAAFARLITNAAKAKQLLPDGQISNERDKLTNLTIRIIVKIATKARRNGGITSFLQFDIKKAFNTVHHQWLIQILRTAVYPT